MSDARARSGSEIVVAPPAALARRFRSVLEREARRILALRERFVFAIAGGSVGEAFFPQLVTADLDWPRVDLCWLDERAVAPDDPESNYQLARRLWLDQLTAAPPRLHRMPGEAADLVAAAETAEADLRHTLGSPPRIDFALAGLGPDGHVASLFPGSPALTERRRWVVAVEAAPKPPSRRLTLTLAAFAAVDLLVIAAFGTAKATAVLEAMRPPGEPGTGERSPAALAVALAARQLWLLDAEAARDLPPLPSPAAP